MSGNRTYSTCLLMLSKTQKILHLLKDRHQILQFESLSRWIFLAFLLKKPNMKINFYITRSFRMFGGTCDSLNTSKSVVIPIWLILYRIYIYRTQTQNYTWICSAESLCLTGYWITKGDLSVNMMWATYWKDSLTMRRQTDPRTVNQLTWTMQVTITSSQSPNWSSYC